MIIGTPISICSTPRGATQGWWTQNPLDGQNPILAMDFVNNRYALNGVETALSSLWTFSRGSAATVDISGVNNSFASGAPRLTPLGYYSEIGRTNTIFQTGTFTDTDCTVTTGVPDAAGGNTARRVNCTSGAGRRGFTAPARATNNVTTSLQVMSAYVRPQANCNRVQLLTGASASTNYANFLLTGAGSVSQSTDANCGIQQMANGYYRIWMQFTGLATVSAGPDVYAIKSGAETRGETVTYDGSEQFDICFWQAEAGTGLTSYIPTTTSSVSRASDASFIDGANFAAAYTQAQGTVYVEAMPMTRVNANRHIVSINDVAQSNMLRIFHQANTESPIANINSGGVSQYNASLPSGMGLGLTDKLATRYASNNFNTAINGAMATQDNSGAVPVSPTRICIGADYRTNFEHLCGFVRKVYLYPNAGTDAGMQGLTT